MSNKIRLSDASKETLERIRDQYGHGSLDSAFRQLAMEADVKVMTDDMREGDEDSAEDESEGWASDWDSGA